MANDQQQGVPGWVWGMLLGLLIFGSGYLLGNAGGNDTVETGGSFTTATSANTDPATTDTLAETEEEPPAEPAAPPQQFSDLPPVLVTELPLEAITTLELIATGGPYPFDRDGLIFQNREGLLPDFPRGHYQEFTVVTPGESTRGARRIVAGAEGELYYTADHYDSFREIIFED